MHGEAVRLPAAFLVDGRKHLTVRVVNVRMRQVDIAWSIIDRNSESAKRSLHAATPQRNQLKRVHREDHPYLHQILLEP